MGRRNCTTSQALKPSTKEWKSIKRTHLSKGKDSTYLFSHLSLIIKMKSSSKKGLQIDVGKNKSLVLLLCSASTRHLIKRMKRVLKATFRNSRQNRINTGARIKSFIVTSEAAILVSERSDRSTLSVFNVHLLTSFNRLSQWTICEGQAWRKVLDLPHRP